MTHSLSLAVKDIHKSKEFYEKLGFKPLGVGSLEDKWIIMNMDGYNIGLFQDMFEDNIITFIPEDARSIHKHLKAEGIEFTTESDSLNDDSGPCHFTFTDPDGNNILFDQHT